MTVRGATETGELLMSLSSMLRQRDLELYVINTAPWLRLRTLYLHSPWRAPTQDGSSYDKYLAAPQTLILHTHTHTREQKPNEHPFSLRLYRALSSTLSPCPISCSG